MLESFSEVEDIIGYKFKDKNLLIRAFTHNSGVKKGTKRSYQNLEFLGDSILSFVIAEALMKRHPSFDEGQLTRMRAAIVSEKPLAETIKKTGLNEFLIMGESETKMGINRNSSVMSDLFESIVICTRLSRQGPISRPARISPTTCGALHLRATRPKTWRSE